MKRIMLVSLLCLVGVSCLSQQEKFSVMPTITVVPSVTFTVQPTSTQLSPTLTKAPVVLMEEQQLNSYTIRVWRDMSYGLDTVVVEKDGRIRFSSEPWAWVKTFDVNNDTESEIVIWQYSGGNHGLFKIQAFMTDANFSKILETPPSICEGEFKDLNNDGTLEFRTCDHTFIYYNWRCSYSNSAFVNAVFKYKEKQGFMLANHEFPLVYDFAADIHAKRIQDFQPNSSWTQEILHDETQCVVLPLVLDYLYSGQSSKAWKVLDDYYHFEDLNSFKLDIQQKSQSSPFFVEP